MYIMIRMYIGYNIKGNIGQLYGSNVDLRIPAPFPSAYLSVIKKHSPFVLMVKEAKQINSQSFRPIEWS